MIYTVSAIGLILVSFLVNRPALAQGTPAWADRDSHAYEYLRELCDRIGSRLTASPQDHAARSWAVGTLRKLGLSNVREEPWTMPTGWTRDGAQAEIRSPGRHIVSVTSLGWSGSTLRGGVEALVFPVDLQTLAQVAAKGVAGQWRGKVLFLRSRGETTDPLAAIKAMPAFLRAASRAGAIAVIEGASGSNAAWNLARVDLADPKGGAVDVPVVRMAPDHQAILERQLENGEAVRLWIDVQNQFHKGPRPTGNIGAEIPGPALPGEVVLLGAHLDSWDVGQGAADDGFGVAAVLGAAEAILSSGVRPRRTIRVVLFNGEEQGLRGSQAYVKQHRAELSGHIAALIADFGDGMPVGWMLNGRSDLLPVFGEFVEKPIGIRRIKVTDAPFLLGDSMSFTLAGVPALDLLQDGSDFPRRRHTHADTFRKSAGPT